jgi:hypothetical protein
MTSIETEHKTGSPVETQTISSDALTEIKQRLGEISYMSASLVNLGSIDDIAADTSGKDIWVGAISLDERFEDKDIDSSELERSALVLSQSYVKTKANAPLRCIHAGQKIGYDSNKVADFERPLGPQFPAGNVGLAIVRSITQVGTGEMLSKHSFNDDFDFEAEVTKKLGFSVGNHQGEHASDVKTGCGAVDGAKEILGIFLDPKRANAARNLTTELLNAAFGDTINVSKAVADVFEDAKIIASKTGEYLPSKKTMLQDVERANKSGAPKLDNNANTIYLVVNNENGTTLHTDEYDAKTGNRAKAFNLDLWNITSTARASYDKSNDQERFIAASVAWSVMAGMTLTDGSIKLIARMPEDK